MNCPCCFKALLLRPSGFRISAKDRMLNSHGIAVFLYAVFLVSVVQIDLYNKLISFKDRFIANIKNATRLENILQKFGFLH